jgi:hypothetical protein
VTQRPAGPKDGCWHISSKTYSIRIGEQDESYYFFGAMFVFLASYVRVFGKTAKVSALAKTIAEILDRAGETALHTIWAVKVAPGAMAMYSLTLDLRFLAIARPVMQAVLAGHSGILPYTRAGWIHLSHLE